MFRWLTPLLYVRLWADRIVIEDARGASLIDEVPHIAVSANGKDVLAVGARARDAAIASGGRCANPFEHPRTLIADFTLAQSVLGHFVRQAQGGGWFFRSPRILLHPQGDPVGGFTQVEWRAFRELAISAGARQVYLWSGRTVGVAERDSDHFLRQCKRK